MKYFIHYILFCLVRYSSAEFVNINHKSPNPHCEGAEKNVLIEHFFNVIFSEFHATPPVCVCVQMCIGQSTYCYPNACLKRDDLRRVDAPQPPPETAALAKSINTGKQFMFVVDENPDFGTGYLESQGIEDTKVSQIDKVTSSVKPLLPYNPDFFKDYNTFKKYRKHLPQVELRYNLRESVKNLKSDIFKVETAELAKTRWPQNKYNIVGGHKLRSATDALSPVIGKSKFFMSMLTDNNVANYPPKYFKRDLKKTTDDLSANTKEVYIYDNAENFTGFSLETLIDNLIKINVDSNPDLISVLNGTEPKSNDDLSIELSVIPLNQSNKPEINYPDTKTTDVISINMTQESNDKNKYTEQNENSKKINGMIINLAKRIDKQNNTSMEMAKRLVDLDTELTTEEVVKETKPLPEENTENIYNKSFRSANTETTLKEKHDDVTPTVANVIEATVTKKVKIRSPRKLDSKTMNQQ